MKYLKSVSIVIIFLTFGCKSETKENMDSEMNHKEHQVEKTENTTKKKPLSPHSETMAMIGDAHIHIDYSSPGVRGRIIFGGLVGYDNIWQAGAHNATWVETNKDLIIANKILPAGKYGFFTIPSKGDWIIIFNKNWEQHGKDEYSQNDDVLRFTVTPKLSENVQEYLKYSITKNSTNSGSISLLWEKVSIHFPFEVK